MGAYDSKVFSAEFSRRTLANFEYIDNYVNQTEKAEEYTNAFLAGFDGVIKRINEIEKDIRDNANAIPAIQKKGKNELKSTIHGLASALEGRKKTLEHNLKQLTQPQNNSSDKLYEITQLLNSLMGVAVLPYEMYKEVFEEYKSELMDTDEHADLKAFIERLYKDHKWNSTFSYDFKNRAIYSGVLDSKIVFRFLRHLRHVACHSGNNALSLYPLGEGKDISNILFYDYYDDSEFAMNLTTSELKELVYKVARFYQNTKLGHLDKTENICNAEKKVKELLGDHCF